jgi:hypothetical protein
MPRFVARPFYTVRELTQLFQAYADDGTPRHAQRTMWNRWKTRRFLQKKGLLQLQSMPGCTRVITLTELRDAWPELVDSMVLADAVNDAAA